MATKRRIVYHRRGPIERVVCAGRKVGTFQWYEGYSANSETGEPQYPWMTKKECRLDATAQGGTAYFEETRTR